MEKLRVVFWGSDEISVPFLKKLTEITEVVLAITQPDKPKGRGFKISATPVKSFSLENDLSVITPEILDSNIETKLSQLSPDLGIVVAYGKKIPRSIYTIPKYKTINVHFSLLPKYRGPAPIEWTIMNGETITGVSIIELTDEIDAGDMLAQERVEITDSDDIFTIERKLLNIGLNLLIKVINNIANIEKVPQKGEISYAPLIKKSDGKINWNEPINKIYDKIRAFKKWPCAYTTLIREHKEISLKILNAEIYPKINTNAKNGQIIGIIKNIGFIVKARNGALLVKSVRPENKKDMSAYEFVNGYHLTVGMELT